MATQQSRAYQLLIFLSWVARGNCSYNNPFPLGWWRVVHLTSWPTEVNRMFPARKSAEKTPLKSTKFISNDYCRICRINLKISGRSKINIFGSKRDSEEFLKTSAIGTVVGDKRYYGIIPDSLPEMPAWSSQVFKSTGARKGIDIIPRKM